MAIQALAACRVRLSLPREKMSGPDVGEGQRRQSAAYTWHLRVLFRSRVIVQNEEKADGRVCFVGGCGAW